uniref:Bursicon n=1 Tax=Romanomermis culicivorax TaxID=13658 RepID=A0A915HYU5_ROMCU
MQTHDSERCPDRQGEECCQKLRLSGITPLDQITVQSYKILFVLRHGQINAFALGLICIIALEHYCKTRTIMNDNRRRKKIGIGIRSAGNNNDRKLKRDVIRYRKIREALDVDFLSQTQEPYVFPSDQNEILENLIEKQFCRKIPIFRNLTTDQGCWAEYKTNYCVGLCASIFVPSSYSNIDEDDQKIDNRDDSYPAYSSRSSHEIFSTITTSPQSTPTRSNAAFFQICQFCAPIFQSRTLNLKCPRRQSADETWVVKKRIQVVESCECTACAV